MHAGTGHNLISVELVVVDLVLINVALSTIIGQFQTVSTERSYGCETRITAAKTTYSFVKRSVGQKRLTHTFVDILPISAYAPPPHSFPRLQIHQECQHLRGIGKCSNFERILHNASKSPNLTKTPCIRYQCSTHRRKTCISRDRCQHRGHHSGCDPKH